MAFGRVRHGDGPFSRVSVRMVLRLQVAKFSRFSLVFGTVVAQLEQPLESEIQDY